MLTNYRGELELNLQALGRYLRKKIWIVLAATVFWGGLWLVIEKAVTVPVYESSSRMIVRGELQEQENSGMYANYFIETATSGPVINGVIRELGLGESYETLYRNMEVYKTSGTDTVNISFLHRDPETAQKVVAAVQEATTEFLNENFGDGELIIIEEAYLPTEPVEQDGESWALNGAFGAFVITLAIIIISFLFDRSIKDSADVESCLEEEVLAVVSENQKSEKDLQKNEAYRLLRTNLQYMKKDLKVISIVGCDDFEGKNSVAYELACSFAQNGKKVLLLDADLRGSSLKQRFARAKDQQGLKDYLLGKYSFEKINLQTDIKNLDVLLAGNSAKDSTELLDGIRFEKLLDAAKTNYEMVIVDTPSMKSWIDGAIITRKCDGALFVIAAEKTDHRMAKNVKQQIEKIGGNILGCVLIKTSKKR